MHRKPQKYMTGITVNGQALPVEVVFEQRRGHRFAITRKRIIMRLPAGVDPPEVQKRLLELQEWVGKVTAEKTTLLTPFVPKEYRSGEVLTIGNRQYILEIVDEDRGSHSGKLVGNTIALHLSSRSTPANRIKAIKTLLSRIVAADFHAEIEQRVHFWNRRAFGKPIKGIFLKYNHSNWGSCSHNGNINLSTRLLFAPQEVQDYVILHELAHLVEHNHSDRFWALVEQQMPDYTEKEKWLKQHGGTCDF
ncbi:MAG: M48 family metallopeptidase [Lewinellaceae bacterium]|nr:M48 family metallopeptidase [Lewinellaceae bacterium]